MFLQELGSAACQSFLTNGNWGQREAYNHLLKLVLPAGGAAAIFSKYSTTTKEGFFSTLSKWFIN